MYTYEKVLYNKIDQWKYLKYIKRRMVETISISTKYPGIEKLFYESLN